MRLRSWATLAALLLFLTAAPAARADEGALAQARAQTFVVEVCTDSHQAEIGSGVAIARDAGTLTIATAAHIVAQQGALRILDVTRRAYYDVLDERVLGDYDLALIRVRAQDTSPIAPAPFAQPVTGEPVWVWGHTGEGFWEIATGSIRDTAARVPGADGTPRIAIDCPACAHGDSGSGVFDAQGRLVGILTRAWSAKSGGPVLFIEVEPATLISQALLAAR